MPEVLSKDASHHSEKDPINPIAKMLLLNSNPLVSLLLMRTDICATSGPSLTLAILAHSTPARTLVTTDSLSDPTLVAQDMSS